MLSSSTETLQDVLEEKIEMRRDEDEERSNWD